MCRAFMFTEIGTLAIGEEGQGNTRKVKPHNVQAVMSTLQACVLQTGQDTTQTGQEHNEM
jgi:hypothetical protein